MKSRAFKTKKKSLGDGMKSVKRGISVRGDWKALQLDPSLFSEEDMGGLVCFEELTDYRLVDTKAVGEERKEKKKKGKRKLSGAKEGELNEQELSGIASENADVTPKQKKKKTKKGKTHIEQKEAPAEVDAICGDDQQAPDLMDIVHKETSVSLENKVKSNKKKAKKKREQAGQTSDEPAVEEATCDGKAPSIDKPKSETSPPLKADPPAKKRVKNWTAAALKGSSGKETNLLAWKGLFVPEQVLQALGHLGFSSPTPIQALALPSAIRDRMDVLGAAETGSGKTFAFGIPMIHSILEWRKSQGARSEKLSKDNQLTTAEHSEAEDATEAKDNLEGEDVEIVEDQNEKEENVHENSEEEGDDIFDSQKLGCVKVIDDIEFDFDPTVPTESGLPINQQQPLLGLVLTPTRELAVQVKHHIDAVAEFTGIKTAIVVGGMAPQKQTRVLKRRPEIVIATPGRLWELIREGHPHLVHLKQLRCLVIDEADRMVERGHFAELENLLEMLNGPQFSPERQTFVFSATLTMVHQLPSRVLNKKGRKVDQRSKLEVLMEKVGIKAKPKVIDLTRKEATVETLTETHIQCTKDEKDFYLYYFLCQYPGRSMVFANSIDCIKRLTSLLTILECAPLPLHANMHQKQRLKNLERFAEKDSAVLLTTDVAARGLDIPNVQHVIHYQVPRTSETYVHRSGRTARATKEGLSLLLIGPDDVINFRKIYHALGKDEELPVFPVQSKCMTTIKERVNMARKIEKIEYHNNRQQQHNSWFRHAAEALDMELDDGILKGGGTDDDGHQQQKMVKGLKKHLKHMLSQPVFKNVMRTKYPTQMGKLALPDLPRANLETALESVSNHKVEQKQRKKQQRKQQQQ